MRSKNESPNCSGVQLGDLGIGEDELSEVKDSKKVL